MARSRWSIVYSAASYLCDEHGLDELLHNQDNEIVRRVVPLVNDTLVLLAVAVVLAMNTHVVPTLKQGIRMAMYGDCLPAFSRVMLRDNQIYYL